MATLADDIFAATYQPHRVTDPYMLGPAGQRKTAEKLRAVLRSAHRYFVDDEVIRAAATLGVQHPDILLAMLSRARLPFPKVWIEWNQRAVLDQLDQPIEEDAPPVIGAYLEEITREGSFPLYRITEMGMAQTPWEMVSVNATSILYSLDSPIILEPQVLQERSAISRFTGVTKDNMDMTLIGSLYSREVGLFANGKIDRENAFQALLPDGVANDPDAIKHRVDLCTKLASHATHVMSEFFPSIDQMMRHPDADRYKHGVGQSIVEFSGTWRLLVSLFALLQARDYTSQERPPDNPARRRFVGNKVVPFLQHWRVKLALPRAVVLRKMIVSTRQSLPRPRHGVEGHWAERHLSPDCEHVDVSETPKRYRCVFCGRARYWVKDHERGSAEVGYVTKDRVVARRASKSD